MTRPYRFQREGVLKSRLVGRCSFGGTRSQVGLAARWQRRGTSPGAIPPPCRVAPGRGDSARFDASDQDGRYDSCPLRQAGRRWAHFLENYCIISPEHARLMTIEFSDFQVPRSRGRRLEKTCILRRLACPDILVAVILELRAHIATSTATTWPSHRAGGGPSRPAGHGRWRPDCL